MAAMAVERWTPERRRELTRTALIEAAAQVFARRGLHGASLDEIAETAGFTRGAIYKNFEDKEGLFLATIDHHSELNLVAFSERFEQGAAFVLDAATLASAWRDILARDPDWFALDSEARLYALRNPEFRQRYAAQHHQRNEAVARFIEDMAETAGISMTVAPALLARIMSVASEGFLTWAYLDPDGGELFQSFFELILSAVVATPPDPPGDAGD
jgi:AcrR family transcriptional regulator